MSHETHNNLTCTCTSTYMYVYMYIYGIHVVVVVGSYLESCPFTCKLLKVNHRIEYLLMPTWY